MLDGHTCVTVDQCGCQLSNGQYISVSENIQFDDHVLMVSIRRAVVS